MGAQIPTHFLSVFVPIALNARRTSRAFSHLRWHHVVGRNLKSEVRVQILALAADAHQPKISGKSSELPTAQ